MNPLPDRLSTIEIAPGFAEGEAKLARSIERMGRSDGFQFERHELIHRVQIYYHDKITNDGLGIEPEGRSSGCLSVDLQP